MVAVTYGVARVPAGQAQGAAPSKGFFARFVDALVESRKHQARRELSRHAHLLADGRDERGMPSDG